MSEIKDKTIWFAMNHGSQFVRPNAEGKLHAARIAANFNGQKTIILCLLEASISNQIDEAAVWLRILKWKRTTVDKMIIATEVQVVSLEKSHPLFTTEENGDLSIWLGTKFQAKLSYAMEYGNTPAVRFASVCHTQEFIRLGKNLQKAIKIAYQQLSSNLNLEWIEYSSEIDQQVLEEFLPLTELKNSLKYSESIEIEVHDDEEKEEENQYLEFFEGEYLELN